METLIQLKDINKSYGLGDKSLHVLKNIDFE